MIASNTVAHALYFARKRHRALAIPTTVPDVVGLTQAFASVAILDAGFTNNAVIGSVDPVASQSPAAGTDATPHSFIDITMTS